MRSLNAASVCVQLRVVQIFIEHMSQRIHRRKNLQISKEFPCTEGCGKAYGSYAALFTHIRNKHSDVKPPQMRSNTPIKIKTGRIGRPVEIPEQMSYSQHPDCRICSEVVCVCVDEHDEKEIAQLISVMSEEKFVKITNAIGSLSLENKTFVRSTEEDFLFKSPEEVQKMNEEFVKEFLPEDMDSQPALCDRLRLYLSVCSRYWRVELLRELYQGIFAMRAYDEWVQCEHFFHSHHTQFETLMQLAGAKKNELMDLYDIVKIVA